MQICYLSQASVLRVTHTVLLLRIGEHTLNLLFSQTVQLFRIPFCLFGNCLFGLLFQIGICFDVGSVHKNSFCVQIPFLCRSFQYPAEHILHRGVVEPALEVIAHRRLKPRDT